MMFKFFLMPAPDSMFEWLNDNLPNGSKILEFGSGTGTIELTKTFEVTSIEENEQWLYLAPTALHLCPISKSLV